VYSIDWDEFKKFKRFTEKEGDNFELLLEFLKSYYNMTSPQEMYDTMLRDDIAPMMLEKRGIKSSADLELILFSHFL
jgi:hypothetical protein